VERERSAKLFDGVQIHLLDPHANTLVQVNINNPRAGLRGGKEEAGVDRGTRGPYSLQLSVRSC
jgi:hypothetical protein